MEVKKNKTAIFVGVLVLALGFSIWFNFTQSTELKQKNNSIEGYKLQHETRMFNLLTEHHNDSIMLHEKGDSLNVLSDKIDVVRQINKKLLTKKLKDYDKIESDSAFLAILDTISLDL